MSDQDGTAGAGAPAAPPLAGGLTEDRVRAIVADAVRGALAQQPRSPAPAAAPAARPARPPAAATNAAEGYVKGLFARFGVESTQELDALMEAATPVIEKHRMKLDGLTPAARRAVLREREMEQRLAKLEQEKQEAERASARSTADHAVLEAFNAHKPVNARHVIAAAASDGLLRYDGDLNAYVVTDAAGAPTGEKLVEFAKRYMGEHAIYAAPPANVGGPRLPASTGTRQGAGEPKPDLSTPEGRRAVALSDPQFRAALDGMVRPREPLPPV